MNRLLFLVICVIAISVGCSSERDTVVSTARLEDFAKLPDTSIKPYRQEKPSLPASTLYALWQERLKHESFDTISCNEVHANGCHAGGPGAIECSMQPGFYTCLGAIATGGSVTCQKGYYACCGIYCYCEKNGRPGKAAPTKPRVTAHSH